MYLHKIIVFDISVTSEMMAMLLVWQNVSLYIILLKLFFKFFFFFTKMSTYAMSSHSIIKLASNNGQK